MRSENFQLQQQGHLYRVNDAPSLLQQAAIGNSTLKKSVRFQKHGSDDSDDFLQLQQQQQQSSQLPSGDTLLRRYPLLSAQKDISSGNNSYPSQTQLPSFGENRNMSQSQQQQMQRNSLPISNDSSSSSSNSSNGSTATLKVMFFPQHQQQTAASNPSVVAIDDTASLTSQAHKPVLSPRFSTSAGGNGMNAGCSVPSGQPPRLSLGSFMVPRASGQQGNSVV